MFDEMINWYSPLKIAKDQEARHGDVSLNVEQKSQLINGPQKSSNSGSNSIPWKGRLRSSNIVHCSSQTSVRNFHVVGESNDSKKNVCEELKIHSITIPGAWMPKKTLKKTNNNNGIQISTQVKYHVQILTYDGFVAHHYAYMVSVIQELEPTCFE